MTYKMRLKSVIHHYRKSSQGLWILCIDHEWGEFGSHINTYCEGIKCGKDWVVRFDDDYGNDQWANAALIVQLHNFTLPFLKLISCLTK